ncbi:MAG TPA: TetR family transcriptional regulator [Candidatus Thermoplasmatota archaeon]|nr:TetR family transcriptional regulator [Candidatus Thermoplasmatota archaeon]
MAQARLLDAALRVLARDGDASPAAVAREAGVSKALIFHHFRSAEGLRDAMAQRVLAETQEGLSAFLRDYPNARERLHALIHALLAEPPEPPAATRNILRFWLESDGSGGARGAARDALLVEFLRVTLKEMRWGGDATRVASVLLARWHGATAVYASGLPVDFEAEAARAVAEIEAMVDR